MAVTARTLFEALQVAAAESTQYTSTGVRTIIDKLTALNTTGAAVTITVKLIANGGVAGAGNTIVIKVLQPNETYTFPEIVGHVLEAGDFISTLASAGASVTMRSSGRLVS